MPATTCARQTKTFRFGARNVSKMVSIILCFCCNCQFDTTFMYTIAVMCFMKIYQFRHPDIASNSYKVFFALGLIMFFEVMGIYHENTLFWILSLLTYFFICVILTSILYHSGQWSLDHWIVVRIFNSTVRLVKTRYG